MMRVSIKAASVTPVSMPLFSGWGLISRPDTEPPHEDALLCAVSGVAGGKEVIALVDEPPTNSGEIEARPAMVFDKPRRMSHGAASQLPMLVLTCAAALHSVGLPTEAFSIGSSSSAPATVVIAGSSGRLPSLLTQVLASRGARPVVAAAEADAPALLELGAQMCIEHNVESFSDALGKADAVVDCVGREDETEWLQERLGAAYVSAASPGLLALANEGAFSSLRSWGQRWGKPPPAQPVWSADAVAAEALQEVLGLIEDGKVAPPAEANGASELTQCYLEYINWARDSETGGRFGFPGESMWPPPPPSLEVEEQEMGGGSGGNAKTGEQNDGEPEERAAQ